MKVREMNSDPWDTRGDDEINGIVWPAPQLATPEMERLLNEVMRAAGEGARKTVEKIIDNVLGI